MAGLSFAELLHRPIFDRLGVAAKLNLARGSFDITALDKSVPTGLAESGILIETFKPVAELMMADLIKLGVSKNELDEKSITIFDPGADTSDIANGATWKILSHRMTPSPFGDQDGKIILYLEGEADD